MRFLPTFAGNSDVSVQSGEPVRSSLPKHSLRARLYMQLLLVDLAAFALGAGLAAIVRLDHGALEKNFTAIGLLAVVYLTKAVNNACYSVNALRHASVGVRAASNALLPAIILVIVITVMMDALTEADRLGIYASIALAVMLIFAGRIWFRRHARAVMAGQMVDTLVIVDGQPLSAWSDTAMVIDAGQSGISPNLYDPDSLDRFGWLSAQFDRIVIDCVPERKRDWALMLKGANVDGEIIVETNDELEALGCGKEEARTTLVVSRRPLSMRARIQKRTLDLIATVPLIILLSPLFAITAIAIVTDTKGPVFFKQNRIGRGNRLFKVLKFRSMRVEGSDPKGMRSTARHDDRITRVGKFIRATSIDELPQLFNVLLGDMSLVGPRPHPIGSLAEGRLFWDIDIKYWHRHQLKPGITGLAQVRGFRGATHKLSDLTDRLQADMEYIEHWSAWRDVEILVKTLGVVVHKNAF